MKQEPNKTATTEPEGISKGEQKELRLIRWANDGFPPIDFSNEAPAILELIRGYQAIKNAAQGVIDSWQKGTQGDIEELKTNKVGKDNYEYWSPAAAMVESGAIAQLRKAINNNHK